MGRWSTRPASGTRSVLSAALARTLLAQSPSSPRSTTSTVQSVMKKSLQPSASSAARSSPREVSPTATTPGTGSASPARTAKSHSRARGSPLVMTNPTVPIALANFFPNVAQPAASPSLELVEPVSFLSRVATGTTTASSAPSAPRRSSWPILLSSKSLLTSMQFAQNPKFLDLFYYYYLFDT